MSKPVTPQDMFDLWQKMVNPGAYPLQSLMFPVMDVKEIDRKIAELETVEHWLKANLGMLQLTMKSLDYQRSMLKGGEKMQASMRPREGGQAEQETEGHEMPNPAMWAWNMMAEAAKNSAPPRAAKKKKKPRAP